MGTDGIPPAARDLIINGIDSVAQLETLLWLLARVPRAATPAEVAADLRMDRAWVARQMSELARAGLVAEAEGRYAYAPSTPELDSAARELALAYKERRVAVITLIFSKPPDHLRDIADAFRLGRRPPPREPPNG